MLGALAWFGRCTRSELLLRRDENIGIHGVLQHLVALRQSFLVIFELSLEIVVLGTGWGQESQSRLARRLLRGLALLLLLADLGRRRARICPLWRLGAETTLGLLILSLLGSASVRIVVSLASTQVRVRAVASSATGTQFCIP